MFQWSKSPMVLDDKDNSWQSTLRKTLFGKEGSSVASIEILSYNALVYLLNQILSAYIVLYYVHI